MQTFFYSYQTRNAKCGKANLYTKPLQHMANMAEIAKTAAKKKKKNSSREKKKKAHHGLKGSRYSNKHP